MYRCLFLILALFFISCSQKSLIPKAHTSDKSLEDMMVEALFYEQHNEPKLAFNSYLKLYKKSKSPIFLQKALLLKLNYNLNAKELLKLLQKEPKSIVLARLEILYYMQQKDYKNAKEKLELLLKKDKYYKNYELMGDIYLDQKNPYEALEYYNLAYKRGRDFNFILKYSSLLIDLKYTQKAKKILLVFEKHQGNKVATQVLLSRIYKIEKNNKLLIKTYEKLYKLSKNKQFIYLAVDILNSQKKYKMSLDLAKKYELDLNTKLFLYYITNDLKAAIKLAMQGYEKTKDKSYLLRAAVFENELDDKNTKSVIAKFKAGLDQNTQAIYLNYYGYLLIDKNINVKYGIELVNRALKLEPGNAFYLDSLAWGYYKLKKCSKAKELLKTLLKNKEFRSSKEGKLHIKLIGKCHD